MLTIDGQKKIANEVISKLRAIDPYCILAGGAPRDWHFGNAANDLDFYIWQQHNSQSAKIDQLKYAGFVVSKIGHDNTQEMYEKNKAIESVFDAKGFDMSVQIISLNTKTRYIVDTFPFSICQAWYTPERGIQLERNFKITEKTGYIFKTNHLYSDADKYVQKITTKFKDKFKFCNTKEQALEKYVMSN